MVRGVYIDRASSDRLLLRDTLDHYLREVFSSIRVTTAYAEGHKAKALKESLGTYSLAAITPDLVAQYRNDRLKTGKSNNTVRLDLQRAFGLRREKAMKFMPSYADKGDHIKLKASWTKGGKPRTIPVRTETQRDVS